MSSWIKNEILNYLNSGLISDKRFLVEEIGRKKYSDFEFDGLLFSSFQSEIEDEIRILQEEDYITEVNRHLGLTEYKLKSKGYRYFQPVHKRILHFMIFNKNHNLFALLAFIISVASLLISILK